MHNPGISFCTTCKGRLHHLRLTLRQNIEDNKDCAPNVEFVLVDYDSPDGLEDWIKKEMMSYIKEGLLSYYQLRDRPRFFVAHAKNVAHRLARYPVVCNVDADNFLQPGFGKYVRETLSTPRNLFLRAPSAKGTFGRIAMFKTDFERLGGYDERFVYGWGFEDTDLVYRAKLLGLGESIIPKDQGFLWALDHHARERTRYTLVRNMAKSCQRHMELSIDAIVSGHLVANQGHRWGAGRATKNLREIVEL
jgi:glycosyltransferase involved in cell wall biosynthesis